MTKEKISLGRRGENAAIEFLQGQGYRILELNYKNALGEIDMIASEGGTLCFIEVKTRTSQLLGSAWEAVSKAKQRKISQVALSYLKEKNLFDAAARFDVVAVTRDEKGQATIEVLKNAFELARPYAY